MVFRTIRELCIVMREKQKSSKGLVLAAVGAMAALLMAGCSRKTGYELTDGLQVQEDRIMSAEEWADRDVGDSQETETEAFTTEQDTAAGDSGIDNRGVDTAARMSDRDGQEQMETGDLPRTQSEWIYVHICGEVAEPGVYRMRSGDRVYQVIEKAGGLSEAASRDTVNQAQLVEDGMKIQIPSRQEAEKEAGQEYVTVGMQSERASQAKGTGTSALAGKQLVNINTASEEELCTLSGIGESRAKSIIRYRSEHGNFAKIEDIMNVEGIKSGAFAKIRDDITVE